MERMHAYLAVLMRLFKSLNSLVTNAEEFESLDTIRKICSSLDRLLINQVKLVIIKQFSLIVIETPLFKDKLLIIGL